MTTIASPSNSAAQSVDSLVLTTGTTGLLKRGLNSKSTSGGDTNSVAQEVGTHVDDAAFGVAADTVSAAGFLADETAPDSVDEGDIGVARMTLDRFQLVEARQRRNSTPTLSNIAGATSSTTILAANTSRNGAMVYNDSTSILYLKMGSAASATSFTVKMQPEDYYEVPFGYVGILTGIWVSATGTARVTEITV